jgi:hypothetical protein
LLGLDRAWGNPEIFWEGGKGEEGTIYRGVRELGGWELGKLEYLGYILLGY